jgi:hypothetical protein
MLKVARGLEPSDLGFGLYTGAAIYGASDGRYEKIIQLGMGAMPRAQHLRPTFLCLLGEHYLAASNPAVLTIQTQLVGGYPASAARDKLDGEIEAARAAAKAKGN